VEAAVWAALLRAGQRNLLLQVRLGVERAEGTVKAVAAVITIRGAHSAHGSQGVAQGTTDLEGHELCP